MVIAIAWLAFMPVLRVWWIATVVKSNRKLEKTEPAAARSELSDKSIAKAIRHYMDWGLQPKNPQPKAFIGLLRPFNFVHDLLHVKWLRLGLVRPIFFCVWYAAIWAISMPIAPFYLTREFDERAYLLRPEWAGRFAPEPKPVSGIPDTPGDARAAQG